MKGKISIVLLFSLILLLQTVSAQSIDVTSPPPGRSDVQPDVACSSSECYITYLRRYAGQGIGDTCVTAINTQSGGKSIDACPYFTNSEGQSISSIPNSNNYFLVAEAPLPQGQTKDILAYATGPGYASGLFQITANTPTAETTPSTIVVNNRARTVWIQDGNLMRADVDLSTNTIYPTYIVKAGGSSIGVWASQPIISYDSIRDIYVIAYRSSDSSSIRLIALNSNGNIVGESTVTASGQAHSPSITYNSNTGRFLLVWVANLDYQIYKTVITLSQSGGVVTLTATSPETILDVATAAASPRVAYNKISNKYLVTWLTPTNTNSQILDNNGAKIGNNKIIYNGGIQGPSVYATSGDKWITVYSKTISGTSDLRITASFIDPNGNVVAPGTPTTKQYIGPNHQATKDLIPRDIFQSTTLTSGSTYSTDTPAVYSDASGSPKAFFNLLFGSGTSNVDVLDMVIEYNSNKTSIDATAVQNINKNEISLFLPFTNLVNQNTGAGIYICPNAKRLAEVSENCTGAVKIENIQLGISKSATVGIKTVTVKPISSLGNINFNQPHYQIDNLQGTGAGLLPGNASAQNPSSVTDMRVYNLTADNITQEFSADCIDVNLASPITNADCKITLNLATPETHNMTFQVSQGHGYAFQRNFTSSATFNWSVTCSAPNYSPDTKTSTATIQIASTTQPPTISLVSPANNFEFIQRDVSLVCNSTAQGTKTIIKTELWSTASGSWAKTQEKTFSGQQSPQSIFQLTNLNNGQYTWSCKSTDSENLEAFGANSTFKINYSQPTQPTPICDIDRRCTPWSQCINGVESRVCDTTLCPDAPTSRSCTVQNGTPSSCQPEYDCQSFDTAQCINGKKIVTCKDTKCGTPLITKEQACTPTAPPAEGGEFPWLIVVVIVIVVVAVVLIYFKKFRKGGEDYEEGEYPYDDEGSGEEPEGQDDEDVYPGDFPEGEK